MKLNLTKNSLLLISFLLIVIGYLSCQKQYDFKTLNETFSPSTYQNQLYSIWSLFYSDSIKSKEQRKNLYQNRLSWSIQEEQQKQSQLLSDSNSSNTFETIDSMLIQGSWINYGENIDNSIDTLIEIKINCSLGKIEIGNHNSWILKRVETTTKYRSNIQVIISPDFYYTIKENNKIVSGVGFNMQSLQKKVIRGVHLGSIEFEYDEPQKKIIKELFNQSSINIIIDAQKLGYKNVYSKYEGELFTPES